MASKDGRAVAYVVLAHCASDVLRTLIESIYNHRDTFAVHLVAKSRAETRRYLTSLAKTHRNILIVPGAVCSWGGFSLVDASLRAIDALLASRRPWSHLLIVSEQHYPLVETAGIASRLEEDVSYMDFAAYETFYPIGKRDIEHRFSRYFQEVEGVGSFFRSGRSEDLSRIVHAGQWLVLSRKAAAFVATQFRDHAVRSFFASSLLPDETAFPTVLMGGSEAERGRIKRCEPTFVAWPHRTDNGGMIAAKATFEAARAAGALFIRKRPPSMTALAEYAITGEALRGPGRARAAALDLWRGTIGRLAERFRADPADALARRSEDAHGFLARHLSPFELTDRRGSLPTTTLHLSLRRPHWPSGLRIHVLSYTLEEYAAILVVDPIDASAPLPFEERRLGGFRTHKLKVRIAGLFMHDQVECPLTGSGLVHVADPGQPRGAVNRVLEAARHADAIHAEAATPP